MWLLFRFRKTVSWDIVDQILLHLAHFQFHEIIFSRLIKMQNLSAWKLFQSQFSWTSATHLLLFPNTCSARNSLSWIVNSSFLHWKNLQCTFLLQLTKRVLILMLVNSTALRYSNIRSRNTIRSIRPIRSICFIPSIYFYHDFLCTLVSISV